ncbi:MAG: hypothetical protein IPH75_14915 [bacterium]|nr:hypothetical protein [bacterium]
MKRITFVLTIVVAISSPTFAKKYENKQYRPKSDSLPLTVAIMPIIYEEPVVETKLDSFFTSMYTDAGIVHPVGPASFRNKISSDSIFAKILDTLVAFEYSKELRKLGPTMDQILDSGKITHLREALEGADLLVLPIKFGLGSVIGRAAGNMSLRLYDLQSGVLIYEKDQDLNVDASGEVGRDLIIVGLIAFTRDPYHKFFLDYLEKR